MSDLNEIRDRWASSPCAADVAWLADEIERLSQFAAALRIEANTARRERDEARAEASRLEAHLHQHSDAHQRLVDEVNRLRAAVDADLDPDETRAALRAALGESRRRVRTLSNECAEASALLREALYSMNDSQKVRIRSFLGDE